MPPADPYGMTNKGTYNDKGRWQRGAVVVRTMPTIPPSGKLMGYPDLWRFTLEPLYLVAASRTAAERLRASASVASWAWARGASGTSMASLTPGMTTAA